MMTLGLTTPVSPATALLVGLAGAVLLPFAAWALTRRRVVPPPPDTPEPARRFVPAEYRGAVRRTGNAVRVVVRDGSHRPYEGFVIDRSAGGLCLTLGRHLAAGAALEVRAAAAPEGSPWVGAVVVHSAKLGAGVWRVGCHFTTPPPGAVLHLFG
jgi:hypothetical protein